MSVTSKTRFTPASTVSLTPQRSDINALLLESGAISRIHAQVLHHLHTVAFPRTIHNLTLSLLRSGECTSFPAAMEKVKQEIREGRVKVPDEAVTEGIRAVLGALREVCEFEEKKGA